MQQILEKVEVVLELVMGRGWQSFEVHVGKSQDCLEKTVGRNMGVPGGSGEISGGKEECLIGN